MIDEISTNPYEYLIQSNKPHFIKPQLSIKKSMCGIANIEDIIIKNFPMSATNDTTAQFTIVCQGVFRTIPIDIITYRILFSVFKTIGRFSEEMEALFILQQNLIKNIHSIKNRESIISFLKSFQERNIVLDKIRNTLIELCK